MSKVGGFTAFTAEAALWVAGAALIANAAGAHWTMPNLDLNGLIGPSPAPSAAAPSHTAPPATGTLVDAFRSKITSSDFQYQATETGTGSSTIGSQTTTATWSATSTGKGSACSATNTAQSAGKKSITEYAYIGGFFYEKVGTEPWSKSPASTGCPYVNASTINAMTLVDKGVAAKFGKQLHKIEATNMADLNVLDVNLSTDLVPTSGVTLVYWADADGTPAGFSMNGNRGDSITGILKLAIDVSFAPATNVSITTPAVANYGQSSTLKKNLAALWNATGKIQGVMSVGGRQSVLAGSVSLVGTTSDIRLTENTATPATYNEIVSGHRFTNDGGAIWIDRGVKKAGTGLPSVLTSAGTDQYGGVKYFGVRKLTRIGSDVNAQDVAGALGLETRGFKNLSTYLCVYADANAKPAGFGASLSWTQQIGGKDTAVTMVFDVFFTATTGVKVTAPPKPWQWIVDTQYPIAFGTPPGWVASDVNKSLNATTYVGVSGTVSYTATTSAMTLDQAVPVIHKNQTGTPSGEVRITVAGQPADSFGLTRIQQGDYVREVVVVHGGRVYEFIFLGDTTKAIDAMATQVMGTLVFTD